MMKDRLFITVFFLVFTFAVEGNQWEPCSKSCGRGRRKGISCVWGICSTVYQGCNTHPCISGWSTWQPCSKSCGGGTKFKVEKCSFNNLDTCPKTYDDCNTHACAVLPTCPKGYNFRYNDKTSCCKVSSETCGKEVTSARRIIGGVNAAPGQWPWAVVLVKKLTESTHCGGSLIHKKWVITAAHCFDPPLEQVYVLLGSVTIKPPHPSAQKREIENHYKHKGYDYPRNDVALVKLKKEATINSFVQIVCLPSSEIVPLDTTCMVLGWGKTQWHVSFASNRLMQVGMRVIPIEACIQGYTNIKAVEAPKITGQQHLCVGILKGGKDACTGDSGGPVVCQRCSTCGWFLAGTTSFGATQCGRVGVPGVYMDIRRYEHWIRSYINLSLTNYFTCN